MTINRASIAPHSASRQSSPSVDRAVYGKWARAVAAFYVSIVLLGVVGVTYFAPHTGSPGMQTVAQGR